jgi:ethylmalonyl-CoA mutase
MVVPEHVEAEQIEKLKAWRASRDAEAAQAALDELARAAKEGRNMVEPSIAAARAGVTTGEWGNVLRGVFGEYRAPTGVSSTARQVGGALDGVRGEVERVSQKIGKRAKFLVGKPGLDGHSNGAEQIAVRARDAGFDVIYAGIRSTPAELVETAKKEGVHCVGLSILSGSHVTLAHEVMKLMKDEGLDKVPLVVGGIIPPADEKLLRDEGVAAVYTPKNYDLNAIMTDLAGIIEKSV